MFSRAAKTITQIIEIDTPRRSDPPSPEMREQLKTLQHSPAFQYLLNRFRLERAEMKRRLESGFQEPENHLRFLQAGIHFAGWFDREISRLTHEPRKAPVEPSLDDMETLRKIQESFEVIE